MSPPDVETTLAETASILPLPVNLDLPYASTLHETLQNRLLAAEPIILEGSQIDRIVTPCIQILVAALQGARSQGVSFELRAPSASLTEAIEDLGLTPIFSKE